MMRSFLFSVRFLTILPLGGGAAIEPRQMGMACRYFPLVGLGIGLIVALGDTLFGALLAGAAADALTLVLWVLLTGALHLDGLADSVDGLYEGKHPDDVLHIMRDPHVGFMGVTAVVLALLLKYAGILSLPGTDRFWSLVLLPVAGRWSMALLLGGSPYVRAQGLGRDLADNIQAGDVRIATLIALILSLFCLGWRLGLLVFVLVWAFTWMGQLYLARRLGGITGDTCGAVGEFVEMLSLVLILIVRT